MTSGATSYSAAANIIIQGSAGPTVTMQSGETSAAVLNGFTITHVGAGGANSAIGAGVYMSGASPVLSNNVVTSNHGCGIGATNSSGPLIEGNDIRGSISGTCGDQVELVAGAGVSVFNGANIQIVGNTIENNTADDCGGGIYVEEATSLLARNNIIRSNQADFSAAIFLRGIQQLSLIQNLIYGNTGRFDVYNDGGGDGAAIYIDTLGSAPSSTYSQTIVSNTVYGNVQLSAAGTNLTVNGEQLFINYLPSESIIENNIFASTDGALEVDCTYSGEYNFAYNDVYSGSAATQNCSPNAKGDISADPLFIDVASGNFHLPANSPAVAAGNVAAPGLPATDLDGLARTYDGTVGMGVYEYHPPTSDTLSLSSSVNPSYVGQTVTFTANITPSQTGGTISGTINFYDGGAGLGTVAVAASGIATLSTASLAAGTHVITATYGGNTSQLPSTSNTVNQVVNLIGTSITLASSENPAAFGQKVTFTAAVQSSPAGSVVPGSVNFYDGSTLLGGATMSNGIASFADSSLAVGTHSITAQYAGSSSYASATSNAVSEQIVSDFSLSVTPNSRSVYEGGATTVTVQLTPNTGFSLPVALSCTGPPAETTCAFSSASVPGSGGTSKLTIQTSFPHQVSSVTTSARNSPGGSFKAAALCGGVFLLMPFCSARRRKYLAMLFLLALGLTMGSVIGCGGPGAITGGTQPGTYTLSVVGTSTLGSGETLSHSAPMTLTVKALD